MTEQYAGPSAAQIANLIPHRVSFERGWFRTTTAICHGGESDDLAFRQRPDGKRHRHAVSHQWLLPRDGHNRVGSTHRPAHLVGL